MSRQGRRAAERQAEEQAKRHTTVIDYFFDRKAVATPNGTAIVLEKRRDVVRRDELWGALEWYDRRVRKENRWWRRLYRWLTKGSPKRINPFAHIDRRVDRAETPAEAPASQRAQFDAEGKLVTVE